MSHQERLIPSEVVLDVNRQYVQNNQARFLKNLDYHGKDGSGAFAIVPLTANELYDPSFTLPAGENFKVGEGNSDDTNELYILGWNSAGSHTLYRIREGRCQAVYCGPELELVRQAAAFVGEGRIHIKRLCLGDHTKTFILWTNGIGTQKHICVEDSIATNSFDAEQFDYFKGDYDRKELVSLGVPTPTGCIGIKAVTTGDGGINRIKKKFWRFRVKFVDVYGRPSEHGAISDAYYQSDCLAGNINCLDLNFEAGNPLVDKFYLEYNDDQSTEWHIAKVYEKYKTCSPQWWTRQINDKDFTYDKATNRVTVRFCATGECTPVPKQETERIENPLPVKSQSLFPLAGGIGLANNEYGFGPFDCDLKNKIHFKLEASKEPVVNFHTRNIEVYALLCNVFHGEYRQAVWTKDNVTVFGGFAPVGIFAGGIVDGIAGKYGQTFPDGQQGWVGYLAGTKYACISTQYKAVRDDNGNVTGWEECGAVVSKLAGLVPEYYLQKFEFKNVPPGEYIFRVANHSAKLNDPGYQRTSAYVKGLTDDRLIPSYADFNNDTELVINVCDKDYDSLKEKKFLQLWDLTGGSSESKVRAGYVMEDRDNNGTPVLPIELAEVISAPGKGSRYTDHNGFYWAAGITFTNFILVRVRQKCSTINFRVSQVTTSGFGQQDFIATEQWTGYVEEKCNRVLVRGKIVDCVTGAGVPHVSVGITRGSFVSTNEKGEYELIVRDQINGQRSDQLLFMGAGTCRILTCDNLPCLPKVPYSQPSCSSCQERVVENANYRVSITGLTYRGLQFGGRYLPAVNGEDWMGRQNFAQSDSGWALNIPTVNDQASFAYPRVRWEIDPAARFPSWMKRLRLRITKNLAYNDFITWVVDRFELIDNSGLENKIAPTQIRLYYSSLNEYNKQNNFATNSTWQLIDEQDSIQNKDIVQFVANGDGTIFPKTITEQVRFDKDGRYFQINYNADLHDLQDGALIKVMRQGTCSNADIFLDLCKTVTIKNGIPDETSGYLDAYDSFYVSRQIPTPVVTTKKVSKAVPGTTNPVVYEVVEESETANVIKPYSWFFEHHSPSDLWGDHCNNFGRPLVSNPLESIICKETEIALSGVLGVGGLVNYLHYFDDTRKKTFDDQGWSGITAVIPQGNVLLCICRSGWFTAPYDDNSVVFQNGKAIVRSAEKQFGIPQINADRWGCLPEDRNTISLCDGQVVWFDRNRVGLIRCDYRSAVNMAVARDKEGNEVARYSSYLRGKVKGVQNSNRYFHGKYNTKTRNYHFTDFDLSSPEYVNQSTSQRAGNDTIVVNVASGELRCFHSCTPEGYAHLRGDQKDEQFFSFKNGIPYQHHKPNPTRFNEFFGVPVPWAMRMVTAVDMLAVKTYQSLEFYCKDAKCYAPLVLTESGQLSRIPRNWFQRGERYWVAPFLCDTATTIDLHLGKETLGNVLFGGDNLRGRWLEFLLVSDPEAMTNYFEITGMAVNMGGVQQQGGKP